MRKFLWNLAKIFFVKPFQGMLFFKVVPNMKNKGPLNGCELLIFEFQM